MAVVTVGFCPILFSAFGFKLHRFVDYNRNSPGLRRYDRIHRWMHIAQKVPRAFSNWQAAFLGSQGTQVFICPTGTSCLQSPKLTSLFLSKWLICGQQKNAKWMTQCKTDILSYVGATKLSILFKSWV